MKDGGFAPTNRSAKSLRKPKPSAFIVDRKQATKDMWNKLASQIQSDAGKSKTRRMKSERKGLRDVQSTFNNEIIDIDLRHVTRQMGPDQADPDNELVLSKFINSLRSTSYNKPGGETKFKQKQTKQLTNENTTPADPMNTSSKTMKVNSVPRRKRLSTKKQSKTKDHTPRIMNQDL